MKLVDLTHTISEDMPVYPGTEPPRLTQANTIEKDGFCETLLTMYSHTGTHMDAPAHLLAGAATLDKLYVSSFCGSAAVVDCTGVRPGGHITMNQLRACKNAGNAEFILFYTGWAQRWGSEAYFEPFPVCDDEVVEYLLRKNKKGAGVDAISFDPMQYELPNHVKLLGSGIVLVENLCNLDKLLGEGIFTFCALPLKYKNADGAPVRAIAIAD